MQNESINKGVLLLIVIFISALFLSMIRQFLMALTLAGIFSALAHPLYLRLTHWLGGRRTLASLTTLLLIVCVVFVPLAGLLGIISSQAIKVGEIARPWLKKQFADPEFLTNLLQSIPFLDKLTPYKTLILNKLGEFAGTASSFLIDQVSSLTLGTVNLVLTVFIMLYCMFFFLLDGGKLLEKVLYYLPLKDSDERRMLDRFTSVSRATLKGTAVIGILQGGLAGTAFAVAGIPSAVFWGAMMAVLSIIPGIGSALIWVPAAIILGATGHVVKAVGLVVFCALVVGSLDNLLRPKLVGKDTQMHELMIFFGTLGGILMFGVPGMIIGPIIAALFVTVWEIYGLAFQDILPEVVSFAHGEERQTREDKQLEQERP